MRYNPLKVETFPLNLYPDVKHTWWTRSSVLNNRNTKLLNFSNLSLHRDSVPEQVSKMISSGVIPVFED